MVYQFVPKLMPQTGSRRLCTVTSTIIHNVAHKCSNVSTQVQLRGGQEEGEDGSLQRLI